MENPHRNVKVPARKKFEPTHVDSYEVIYKNEVGRVCLLL